MSFIATVHVFPSDIADSELERRVVAYLAARNFLALRRLSVFANRGVVVLSGRIDSYYERQVAIESARRVAGVIRIVDRMIVNVKSTEQFTDEVEQLRALQTARRIAVREHFRSIPAQQLITAQPLGKQSHLATALASAFVLLAGSWFNSSTPHLLHSETNSRPTSVTHDTDAEGAVQATAISVAERRRLD